MLGLAVLVGGGCYRGLGAGSEGDEGAGGASAGSEAGSGGEPDTPQPSSCDALGTQPLRRISSYQYAHVLADLLPPDLAAAALAVSTFPPTLIDNGFSTWATANTVSTNESIAIEDNAEAIAQVFWDGRTTYAPQLVPCLPADYTEADIDGCIDAFVAEFGARAFRRPLTAGESEIVAELYQTVRGSDGAEAGLTAVLHYVLQAPALLYATEPADPDAPGELVALSSDQLATRLALLFGDSLPDDELRAAVAAGALVTRADVELHARRLAAAPAAERAFARFHDEWMRGFVLAERPPDDPRIGEMGPALAEELVGFATWFFGESDGSFATLMTTEEFPIDPRLADLYAIGGDEPGAEHARHGIVTTAAAMAAIASQTGRSLIVRGAFVRNHLLCEPVPPLPGNVDIEGTLGDTSELPTARERLAPLLEVQPCAGCHAAFNPIGFPFETYDPLGAYRTQENGSAIDPTVEFTIGSLSGDFADAAALLDAIAISDAAHDCYATHWFRYALGRGEAEADACALDEIRQAFRDAGGDVRELLVAIAVSDAFRFRMRQEGE